MLLYKAICYLGSSVLPSYATAQNVEEKNPLDANLSEQLKQVCTRRQFQQERKKKKKREQPCLKCCFRNLPSHPGTPALPSSLQGCLPPSHSARWAAGTLAQHSLGTAPALFTHLEKQTRGGGCSGITHQTHRLPRGFRHFQGGNPQGCAGETPAASPDLSTSSRLGPGCPCEPRHPRSSPVDYLRLHCCGRGRRARGRRSGSWSFSPGRCTPHPSSCPGRTARAHQQHPQPGCSPFVGTFGNYRFSGAKHSLIAAGAGGIDFLFCFKCS